MQKHIDINKETSLSILEKFLSSWGNFIIEWIITKQLMEFEPSKAIFEFQYDNMRSTFENQKLKGSISWTLTLLSLTYIHQNYRSYAGLKAVIGVITVSELHNSCTWVQENMLKSSTPHFYGIRLSHIFGIPSIASDKLIKNIRIWLKY